MKLSLIIVAGCILMLSDTHAQTASSMSLTQPLSRAVYQRDIRNFALVPIAGTVSGEVEKIEARCVVMPGGSGKSKRWPKVTTSPEHGSFKGTLKVPAGGRYRIEVRALNGKSKVAESAVEKVGVGEVIVTAGQSNSTNSGDVPTKAKDDRVSVWNGTGWQPAVDPLPIATHAKGSAWPTMADILIEKLNVPIGLIAVGVGGTPILDWLHTGSYAVIDCYPRLRDALVAMGPNGVRAVLWHQGESDTMQGNPTDQYADRLRALIRMSRKDAGWEVPWFIATASFIGEKYVQNQSAIQIAQKAVCDGKTVFQGPTTDDMVGDHWRNANDHVHFSVNGQLEHGRRWAEVLLKYLPSPK